MSDTMYGVLLGISIIGAVLTHISIGRNAKADNKRMVTFGYVLMLGWGVSIGLCLWELIER